MAFRLRRKTRGFTLIEMMMVVAIIALLLVLAFSTFTNRQTQARIADTARDIKTKIEIARSLSGSIPGESLGNTDKFVNCVNLPAAFQTGFPHIVIDQTSEMVTVPVALQWDGGGPIGPRLATVCEQIDVVADSQNRAQLEPSSNHTFYFLPGGQLIVDNDGGGVQDVGLFTVWFRLDKLDQAGNVMAQDSYGYRVLRSGVICQASVDAPNDPNLICDRDV